MGIKISLMDEDTLIGGGEMVPVSDAGSPKRITTGDVKDYTIDQIEAIGAGSSVSGADGVYVLQGGALKPVDIDLICQRAIDTIWGKGAEGSPDSADVLPLKDGGVTEKIVTLENLAAYILSAVEGPILDVSDLDVAGALADANMFLVTQGTTGKKVTYADLVDAIYGSLDTYVGALDEVTGTNDSDVFYVVQGGIERYVTLADIKTHIGVSLTVSGTPTVDYVPQWASATALKGGLPLVTDFAAGSDSAIPTSAAVRGEMDTVINDSADIGADLVDADTILVDDGAAGTTQRKSALSRLWTYVTGKIQGLPAKTAPVAADILTIQDTEAASALKEATLTNVMKGLPAVVGDAGAGGTKGAVPAPGAGDTAAGKYLKADGTWVVPPDTSWDGDITDVNIDGAVDIGADLVDADLIVVDDGAVGTNRKSALSRLWTYVTGKIQGLPAKTAPVAADILTIQDTEAASALKEATLTNVMKGLPAVVGDAGAGGTKGAVPAPGAGDTAADKYLRANGTWTTPPGAGWDGDITDMNIDGGVDIGADLVDADLIVVDDGAVGTNRKSALSRLWTYITGKLASAAGAVLGNVELKDVAETRTAPSSSSGTLTLNLENGNVFEVTLAENVTSLVISNPPASGKGGAFTLILKQDATGGRTFAWPAAVKWAGGTGPSLSTGANDVDLLTFVTTDAGTIWRGMLAGADFS